MVTKKKKKEKKQEGRTEQEELGVLAGATVGCNSKLCSGRALLKRAEGDKKLTGWESISAAPEPMQQPQGNSGPGAGSEMCLP